MMVREENKMVDNICDLSRYVACFIRVPIHDIMKSNHSLNHEKERSAHCGLVVTGAGDVTKHYSQKHLQLLKTTSTSLDEGAVTQNLARHASNTLYDSAIVFNSI